MKGVTMPRSNNPPKYCKNGKYAIVYVNGKKIYLGLFGSPESRQEYARVVAEWQTSPAVHVANSESNVVSVSELAASFLEDSKSRQDKIHHGHNVIYIPGSRNTSPKFDDVFLACSAGFGVCMGTGVYPTAAKVGRDGLAVPSAWKNGGHAMCFAAAIVVNGKRYLYLLNSHGNRYDGDKYHEGRQPGCTDGRHIRTANYRCASASLAGKQCASTADCQCTGTKPTSEPNAVYPRRATRN